MGVRAGEEKAYFVPRHGAGIGDGNACEPFVRAFVRPLEESRGTIETSEVEAPLIEAAALIDCPIAGRHIDLSMRGYADDVLHALPIADNSPFRVAALARASNSLLSSKLREQRGFAQYADKEVVLPVCVGPG
eukprot:7447611-Pyramimonas_sp.AAC.1